MTTKTKNILVFLSAILAATAVYIWFYPLNKGTLIISANTEEYSFSTQNISSECNKNPCIISLKSGVYRITLSKNGYFNSINAIAIKRGETQKLNIVFKKIPELIISDSIPDKEIITNNIPNSINNQLAPTQNLSGTKIAYIDNNDDKLKVWENNSTNTIALLRNISENLELFWSPDNLHLFGIEDNNVYFIDINKAARNKNILEFSPKNPKWSQKSDYLLINDAGNNLYKINLSDKKLQKTDIKIDLTKSKWLENGELIFFAYDTENNSSSIQLYKTSDGIIENIITESNFSIDKISSNNGIIYFHDSDSNTWYYLDF